MEKCITTCTCSANYICRKFWKRYTFSPSLTSSEKPELPICHVFTFCAASAHLKFHLTNILLQNPILSSIAAPLYYLNTASGAHIFRCTHFKYSLETEHDPSCRQGFPAMLLPSYLCYMVVGTGFFVI